MLHTLLVFIGGGIGASLRHWTGVFTLRQFGPGFPYGTLTVNIVGSFLMGLLIGYLVRRGAVPNEVRLLLATGFLGGFTTFSAFSLDFANMWHRGEMAGAMGYAAASFFISIAAVFAGLWLMRSTAI